ncbi:MAG: hypothetical protein MUE60_06160 [Candidatus Eisenbacteria bacterium]|nr:hypothetical protein [Candidatus Eisenbacteria bacterium]
MIGATRDGACSAQLSREDIQRLVKGIGIVRADTLSEHDPVGLAARRMVTTCCSDSWTAEGVEIYSAFERPPSLRLANGTAFEHLVIAFRPQENEACLCASYAYG